MEASELIAVGLKYWPHIVFGLAGFFILRMIKGWDEAIKDTQGRVCRLEKAQHMSMKTLQAAEMILTEWALMKKGIADAEANIRNAGEKIESISVLKRDRDTAFKRIDELRGELQVSERQFVERSHTLSNRITAIRSALDAHDIPVSFIE